jgi:hypothetical protein
MRPNGFGVPLSRPFVAVVSTIRTGNALSWMLLLNLGAPSMLRDFPALLLFTLLVPLGWSQSAADLAQKYPHHEVYEVEPGVVMSAKFASSGLVCEMHVEQTH